MKAICRYSGVEYELFTHWRDPKDGRTKLANSFKHLTVAGIHPVFTLTTTELLAELSTWAARKLTRKDSRILFCAILHRTELVEFRTFASPNDATIANNMAQLARVLAWKSALGHDLLRLPRYVISKENKDLRFIPQWIENWTGQYNAWKNNRERTQLISQADGRAALLEKLIKSGSKTTENYAGTLALWAFDATGLPNRTEGDKIIRERWIKVFRARGTSIFNIPTPILEDMLEWFEENLEHGSIQAAKVLEHLRRLLHYNTRGLEAALGFIDGNTYQILRDNVEVHNRKAIAASAPLEEPTETQIGSIYPNKVAFLRARSAWRIAQSQKEIQHEAVAELEKKLDRQADALFEFHEDTEADLNQLKLQLEEDMQSQNEKTNKTLDIGEQI